MRRSRIVWKAFGAGRAKRAALMLAMALALVPEFMMRGEPTAIRSAALTRERTLEGGRAIWTGSATRRRGRRPAIAVCQSRHHGDSHREMGSTTRTLASPAHGRTQRRDTWSETLAPVR